MSADALSGDFMKCWLKRSVLSQLLDEGLSKSPLETGGLLMGYWNEDQVIVNDFAGPGPGALHQVMHFTPDYDFHTAECKRIFTKSHGLKTYLGDWHTHPNNFPTLSDLDERALMNIAAFKQSMCLKPLMLILGKDYQGKDAYNAYVYNSKTRVTLSYPVEIFF